MTAQQNSSTVVASGPLHPPPAAEAPESLAGYRIVRKIGSGERADVYLATTTTARDGAAPRALKVFGGAARPRSIDDEIEALDRARGPHVVELVDLATDDDGVPMLVLARIPGPSIARLIADRNELAAGEAITLLAPIAATVARLHEAGVVHAGIRASAVLIDERGAPVLCCFGAAELISPHGPAAARDIDPGVRRDNEGLSTLVAGTLAHVNDPDLAGPIDELIDWMRDAMYDSPSDFSLALESRLFDLTDASRLRGRNEFDSAERSATPGSRRAAISAGTTSVLPADHAEDRTTISRARQVVSGTLSRLLAALRTVRRGFWVVAIAALVAVVAAIVLSGAHPTTPYAQTPATNAPPSAGDSSSASTSGSSSASTSAQDPRDDPSDSGGGAVAGDDPVLALDDLLRARSTCFDQLSLECLGEVDQRGSVALQRDREAIELVRDGAELPSGFGSPDAAGAATLTQRLGDSALVLLGSETQPASILMVRSEAGWRIREVLGS